MKDIRVYDFEFNLLCIMTDCISAQWRLLYRGIGSFEGHFRLNDRISDIILENRYIVLIQGDKQAICTGRIVDSELVVCGRTVNWILTKRIRPPFKTKNIFGEEFTDPETILLYCLRKGLTEPPKINSDGYEIDDTIDKNKRIENFVIPQAIGAEKLTSHFWRISANDLGTICDDLCEKLGRGYKVVFDVENRQWVFEFIYPKNNTNLISQQSRTAYDIKYTDNMLELACGGWYSVEDADAEESKDKWHYISRNEMSGIYAWDCVLSGSGKSEAEALLAKKVIASDVTAKLRRLKFGVDYQLGDIVPVYVKFGNFERMENYIVSGVDIKLSQNDSYEEPTLEKYE